MINRKLCLFFIGVCLIWSCKKEDSSPPTKPEIEASFSFLANGVPHNWKGTYTVPTNFNGYTSPRPGSIISKYSQPGGTYFDFSSCSANFAEKIIVIINQPFAVTTYSGIFVSSIPYDIYGSITLSGETYYASSAGDFMTLTINKIDNNYVNGTISAKLSDPGSGAKMEIKNGVFSNVKVEQY